ncbi:hypothetical protein KKC17_03100 [Patescibacteria group bacterium]|nr:hypothetical protein [Patescibacteria group bacterium]
MLENFFTDKNKPDFLFKYRYWLVGLVVFFALDIVSWLGWQYKGWGSLLAIGLALGWLWLASRKISWGLIWLVAELIVGSFGRLFIVEWAGWWLPWRYLIFIFASGLLIVKIWSHKEYFLKQPKEIGWWLVSLFVLLSSLVVAIVKGNSFYNIFLDMNGYLYLLLWPMFLLAKKESADLWLQAKEILSAAVIWLGLKTLFMFFLFGHYPAYELSLVYSWWRDTGLGEITSLGTGYYRIFSQSHLWSTLAAISGLAYLAVTKVKNNKNFVVEPILGLFIWFNLMVVLVSMSRSLWLGLLVGWFILLVVIMIKAGSRSFFVYGLVSFILLLSAWGGLKVLSNLTTLGQPTISSIDLSGRFSSNEAAGQSRLQLLGPLVKATVDNLWLGAGFGATVEYQTSDPRVVKATAGGTGWVTTYAFEWGYLDLLYKLGLIGAIIYLWFFLRWLDYTILKSGQLITFYKLAAVGTWGVLLVTNLTTPYLNHPLGIGAAMAIMIFLVNKKTIYV